MRVGNPAYPWPNVALSEITGCRLMLRGGPAVTVLNAAAVEMKPSAASR